MATERLRLRRCADRWLALLALTGFVAGSLGVPVLVPPEAADGLPYPCRGHRCGCTSAQQCWLSCCCLTHQEKLAWARRHGVEPPPAVVRLAHKEAELAQKAAQQRERCACCRPATASVCDTKSASGGAQLEAGRCGKPQDQPSAAWRMPSRAWSIAWVCAISARRCYGQAQQWMALGSVAPPPERFEVSWDLVACPLFMGPILSLRGISDAPQPPPPRS